MSAPSAGCRYPTVQAHSLRDPPPCTHLDAKSLKIARPADVDRCIGHISTLPPTRSPASDPLLPRLSLDPPHLLQPITSHPLTSLSYSSLSTYKSHGIPPLDYTSFDSELAHSLNILVTLSPFTHSPTLNNHGQVLQVRLHLD